MIGRRWVQFKAIKNWRGSGKYTRTIAWLEPVAIRLGLLMAIQLGHGRGKNLTVWTDNTTSQAAVESRKSRDREVNEEWKIIQRILISEQIDLNPRRVISEDNMADKLSRGFMSHEDKDGILVEHKLSNMVCLDLPTNLALVLFTVVETPSS